jgi:plastocyanin
MPATRRTRSFRTAARAAGCAGAAIALLAAAGCSNREAAVNKNPHTGVAVAHVVDGIQQLRVTTGLDYRFHPSTIIVHPGRVRIVLANTESGTAGGPPHNLQVTGLPGIAVPLAYPGGAAEDTFTAPAPGRYRFVCTIHVAQGQTGVLVVKPGQAPS